MDISTLPDEMLTNILSKTSYGIVRNLRKLNSRIDNVARRNEISTRVPVQKFELYTSKVLISLNESIVVDLNMKKGTSRFVMKKTDDFYKVIDEWLAKVTLCSVLNLSGPFSIDEEMLRILIKHRKSVKNLTKFCLLAGFCLSTRSSQIFLWKICPNLNYFSVSSPLGGKAVETTFNEKMVGNRKWKHLCVSCINSEILALDDQYMLKIAPNCESFSVESRRTSFTLEGAIRLMKMFKESKTMRIVLLGVLTLGDVALDDVEQFILSRVAGIEMRYWDNQYEEMVFVINVVGVPRLPTKCFQFCVDLTKL